MQEEPKQKKHKNATTSSQKRSEEKAKRNEAGAAPADFKAPSPLRTLSTSGSMTSGEEVVIRVPMCVGPSGSVYGKVTQLLREGYKNSGMHEGYSMENIFYMLSIIPTATFPLSYQGSWGYKNRSVREGYNMQKRGKVDGGWSSDIDLYSGTYDARIEDKKHHK